MLLIWTALSIAVGMFASSRGRSGFGWFLISILFSPLVGFVFVLLAGDKKKEAEASSLVVCPFCAESIKSEAVVCKHCGKDVPKQEPKKQEYYC